MAQQSRILQAEYQLRFSKLENYRNRVWQTLCQYFFEKLVPPSSIVLDLGAGWGEFSRNIRARKVYSMDLNPDCGARIGTNSVFLHQDCSERWPFEDGELDLIFTSNFLEHLPSKASIETTLREATRCLRVGGRIICVGPNIKFTGGSYWDFWDHHVAITDSSLAEILELSGFDIIKKTAKFLPYSMTGRLQAPVILIRLYLTLPFLWRLFGKQFLIIGSKNSLNG